MSKPGIDWTAIERRVRDGEPYRAIAAHLTADGTPISHNAIMKRAKKEGWVVSAERWKREVKAAVTGNQAVTAPVTDHRPVMFNKDTPEIRALILADLERGLGYTAAAERNGVSANSLRRWCEADDVFAGQCQAAIRSFEARHVDRIDQASGRGDWKASAFLLAKNPTTKQDYGDTEAKGGGPQFVVVLNIPRAGDTPPQLEATDVAYSEVTNG